MYETIAPEQQRVDGSQPAQPKPQNGQNCTSASVLPGRIFLNARVESRQLADNNGILFTIEHDVRLVLGSNHSVELEQVPCSNDQGGMVVVQTLCNCV